MFSNVSKHAAVGYVGSYLPGIAFDNRIKACVAWGAVYDFSHIAGVPMEAIRDLLGATNDQQAAEKMKNYALKGVVGRIRCPLLIIQGEADTMTPVGDAQKTYDEAICEKELNFQTGRTGGRPLQS